MRFGEAKHRKVLDTSAAAEIGRIDGFLVDAERHRVGAVLVGKHKGGSVLAWDDIQAFGPDAVTVRSADAIRDGGHERLAEVVGARVLSARGYELGTVEDVEFDPESGTISRLLLGGGSGLDGSDLMAVGSYAAIVRHTDGAPQ